MAGTTTRVGSAFGHYEIRALLGRGGMGEVYEAYDTVKDRIVALKILAEQHSDDETFRERFRRESHAAAKLQEPHVVPIHDWGDMDGTLYIDMRRVDGVDLRALLADGPLDPQRAVGIVGQIAAALDGAHAAGLIHRDVKPENIILTAADFAYLVDFGIAEAAGDTRLTTIGSAVGSLTYMAPERFGSGEITGAADIYSLACVLHELLTGSPPYPPRNPQQIILAHTSAPLPRPSVINPAAVPAAFDAVIARGMAKEPDDRYGSAGALARAAQRALRPAPQPYPELSATLAATPAPRPYLPPPRPHVLQQQAGPGAQRQNWVLPAVVAAAVAVIVAGLGITVLIVGRSHGGDSPTPTAVAGVTPQPPRSPDPSTPELPAGARVCPTTSGPAGDYTTSAAGTLKTTCQFAEAVRVAYGQSGPPSSEPRQVNAFSPVTKVWYPMRCTANGALATCTGGDDAVVYAY